MQSNDPRKKLRAPSFPLFSAERVGDKLTLESIDGKLAHAASESESEAAHRAAGWYAQQLLNRFSRAQVLEWLRTGVPQSALVALR
jgi:hypothetical protein